MRYRIVRDRVVPIRPTALTTERNPKVAARQRAARAAQAPASRPLGMFEPVGWPGTRRDVAWSSKPVFTRPPAGWCRTGFFA